jgi:hypothetical protein
VQPASAQDREDLTRPVTHGDLASLNDRLDEIQATLKQMAPDGDIDGHRRYHEALIEAQRRRVKIYDAILEKTLSALLWAVVAAVVIALWDKAADLIATKQSTVQGRPKP